MDRKSKILTYISLAACLLVGAYIFFRFYIARDYDVSSEVACDPEAEQCFVRPCESDDPLCTPKTEPTYYKIQTVRASAVAVCDPFVGACPEIDCENTPTCRQKLCDEDDVPEGETCNDVALYQAHEESTQELPEGEEAVEMEDVNPLNAE